MLFHITIHVIPYILINIFFLFLQDDVPLTMISAQEELVVVLVKELATPGSAILIFVSGLSDIISLSEKLELFSRFQL